MVAATPETPGPAPTGAGRWARWRGPVLFISLGLNLFLVGIMAGGWWHHHQGRHWRQHVMGQQMGQIGMHRGGAMPGQMGQMGMPGRPGEAAGGPMRGGMAAIREAIQQLPEADRKPFEEAMAQRRAEVQQLQQDVRHARLKANDAMRAEPFDRKAMADALAGVREKIMAIQAKLHEGLVDAVSKLPADKRRDFAETISTLRSRP
ncbi:MAG: periplasmic heavy metal sensor [Rhodospirillales bacterium]